MISSAITTITRREVRDTLSDWRILLPIALLTFLVPQLMVGASSFVIGYVEDAQLATRLIPFVVLVVGFIPASFSLITALEAFVGERERNSLEALLAMPVSDRELYIGKLSSSLFTPMMSSFIAMLTFSFLLYVFNNELYVAAITATRLLQIFCVIGLMALTMVSGSVVISSHMSSIRAANLMSSFILIPMMLLVQLSAFLIINDRWDILWWMIGGLAVTSLMLIRTGLSTFNREEILSREHSQVPFRPLAGIRHWVSGADDLPVTDNPSLPGREFDSWPTRMALQRFPRFASAGAIAERELRETLTDWRVLLPVFILTVIIPLALISGADFAIAFVGEASLVGRLVPFALLLVGFVPSSFSLITALESFVGERERNSLESLLAMPVSDNALYISKLFSSLLVPLLSSFTAMLVFAFLLATMQADLYFYAMTWIRLLQLLLMIGIITLLMVAGAVVISSHTSSIRAATLLASFVLLPTTIVLQLQVLFVIAQRWDLIWMVTAGLAVVVVALIRTGMATFNREEILSREHEQLSFQNISTTFMTFLREYRPAGILPEEYQRLPLSLGRFYRHELPALLRELRLPLLVALIAVLGGLLFGAYAGQNYKIAAFDTMLSQIGQVDPPSLELGLYVFANNLRISIISNVFSIFTYGLFAFLVPAVAFGQIGFVASTLAARGGSWFVLDAASPLTFLLAYIVPHGIIELPAFILSAALGLRIGASLMSPPSGFSVGQNMLWALANFWKVWLLLLLPMILLGSLIEGLITPLVVQALYQM